MNPKSPSNEGMMTFDIFGCMNERTALGMNDHLERSMIVIRSGFSGSGLSMPSFRASTSLLTSSRTLASDAKTQLA